MFARGSEIYCKYEGITLVRKVEATICVLGSEGGKITAPPRFPESTICAFKDEVMRKSRDCFVICK
jgi:hypothetical protein